MQDFRELRVWRKAHDLALAVYHASARWPASETYGLASQVRRAAVSIPANLAEGSSRGTDPDFARFVSVAMGSASEVEYLLLLAHDLRYLDTVVHETLANQTTEVKRMLASLLKKLRADGR